MTVLERICRFADFREVSEASICRYTGINTARFCNWKKRKNEPPLFFILGAAEYLNANPMYLITGKGLIEPITTDEEHLIESFRALSSEKKEKIQMEIELLKK